MYKIAYTGLDANFSVSLKRTIIRTNNLLAVSGFLTQDSEDSNIVVNYDDCENFSKKIQKELVFSELVIQLC